MTISGGDQLPSDIQHTVVAVRPTTPAEAEFRTLLAPLLALGDDYPDATELVIDGDAIGLDLGNTWQHFTFAEFPGLTERDVRAAAAAAAVLQGGEFGSQPPARPMFRCKIPPDLRVSVTAPPVADRFNMAIRFLRSRSLSLEDYVAAGIMTPTQANELHMLLGARRTLIVSGSTSSGKTTLLRCLLGILAATGERLILIEDTPELNVPGRNVLHWSTTLDVSMTDLLKQALTHRPDRIIVGEVRGPEAFDLLTACNTGHEGVLATLHSNGAEDTLARLLGLARMAQPNYGAEWVERAIHADAHLVGRGDKRRLAPIWIR